MVPSMCQGPDFRLIFRIFFSFVWHLRGKCCWWVADVTIAVVVAVIVLVCKGQLLRRIKSKCSQGGKVEKSGSLLAVINHQCLLHNLFFWLVFLSFYWLYVSLGYHCDWKTWTHELDTQFHKKLTMIHDAPMSCYIKLFNDIDDLCLVLLWLYILLLFLWRTMTDKSSRFLTSP